MKEIEELWSEFQDTRFPRGYTNRANDDLNVDLALWDGHCAGCIQTFVQNGGTLDGWRLSTLVEGVSKLKVMRTSFGHDNLNYQLYIDKLVWLSEKVLAACD